MNINGAESDIKRVSLFTLIELQYLDVTLVQETHSDGKNEEGKEREKESPREVILSPKLFHSEGGWVWCIPKAWLSVCDA